MRLDQDRDPSAGRAIAVRFACSLLIGAGCATEVADGDGTPGMHPSSLGAAAQGFAGSAGSSHDAPSFGDVYPIFEATCGGGRSGCHVTGTSAQLALPDEAAGYDALVSVASGKCAGEMLVVPGDADASVLVQVLESTSTCAKPMPLGRDPLSADQLATVRAWIDTGALRN